MPTIKCINAFTDIKVTIKDIKHARRIVAFKFDITKQAKPKPAKPQKNLVAKTVNKVQPSSVLCEKFKSIGVTHKEFTSLINKHEQEYLEQLVVYAKYRASKQTIKSMFKYLCGVLNNKPALEDLYTPNCVTKQKQAQHQLLQVQQKEEDETAKQNQNDEFNCMSKKVEQYLDRAGNDELKAIEQAFSQTAFACSLAKL